MGQTTQSVHDTFGEQLPNSLVAVMDIMGFSSVLEQNPNCLDLLTLGTGVVACMTSAKHGRNYIGKVDLKKLGLTHSTIEKAKLRIVVFQFSDTVVFALPKTSPCCMEDAVAFFDTVAWAVSTFLDRGLPVQCQIEFGNSWINRANNLFLGIPFLAAHQKASNLGFSGIVISDAAMNAICKTNADPPGIDLAFQRKLCRYVGVERISVPSKNGKYDPSYCLDWLRFRYGGGEEVDRQYLVEQFTAFSKSLSDSVIKKIENTEWLIQQFRAHAKRFQEEEQLLEAARIPIQQGKASTTKKRITSTKQNKSKQTRRRKTQSKSK